MNTKLSVMYKGRPKELHHQYGKRWINNGTTQLMVPATEVTKYLQNNWSLGKLTKR